MRRVSMRSLVLIGIPLMAVSGAGAVGFGVFTAFLIHNANTPTGEALTQTHASEPTPLEAANERLRQLADADRSAWRTIATWSGTGEAERLITAPDVTLRFWCAHTDELLVIYVRKHDDPNYSDFLVSSLKEPGVKWLQTDSAQAYSLKTQCRGNWTIRIESQ